MTGKRLFLALGLLVLAIAAYRYWTGDERAIRARLSTFERIAAKTGEEQPVDALLKANKLVGLMTDPCAVQVDEEHFNSSYNHKQMQDALLMARRVYITLQVSLRDLHLKITPPTAHIQCTMVLRGTLPAYNQLPGNPPEEAQKFEATMRKIDGHWLITSVRLLQAPHP